jgi:hypothetical protein
MSETKVDDGVATCRGCRRVLRGKPYYMGGNAYDPETGEQCKKNHYGGYVCSFSCDYRAVVDLESSMPGHGTCSAPSCYADRTLRANWPEHYQ